MNIKERLFKTHFTLIRGFERGDFLELIRELITNTVQIGVLIAFMHQTWTANLNQSIKVK